LKENRHRRAKVDVGVVGRLERGVGNPNLQFIFAIAEALDMPGSSLLIGVGIPVSDSRS
jgi:transcriptional regulator with XRE-family HTH domain